MLSVRRLVLLVAFSTLFQVPCAYASDVAQPKSYMDELYASFQAAGAPLINAAIAGVATVGVGTFFAGKYMAMREFYRLPTPGINLVGREGVLGAYDGANPAEKLAQVVRLSKEGGALLVPGSLADIRLGDDESGKSVYFKDIKGDHLIARFYDAMRFVREDAARMYRRK